MAKSPKSSPQDLNLDLMREVSLRNPDVHPARHRRTLPKKATGAARTADAQEADPSSSCKDVQAETQEEPRVLEPDPQEETAPKADPKPDERKPADAQDAAPVVAPVTPGLTVVARARLAGPLVLRLTAVTKSYGQDAQTLEVLRGVDLEIAAGQIVGLIGPSGSGKSTLLQITGLLDAPTSGQVGIAGQATEQLDDTARTLLRRSTVGFVYQFHHLLKEFSALENVMIPQRIAGVEATPARQRAEELLAKVGLSHRVNHRPAKLSGGEQQRVAVARALANRPTLLLADEPTGNLDPQTAEDVFALLLALTRQEGMAALVATHNLDLGARMDRMVRLNQGLVQEVQQKPPTQEAAAASKP